MNILFIGDIVGKGGRKVAKELIPQVRQKYNCVFCVANGENMAAGAGITAKCIKEIPEGIIDVITLGDHVWDQKEFEKEIIQFKNVLRPANFNPVQPGSGFGIFRVPAGGEIAIINLAGRVFMKEAISSPFIEAQKIIKLLPARIKCIFVDIHGEATSEKIAMGRFLDGKVTAVLGTHTHVQTSDAKILPNGTAYMTDIGMTGAVESIIGRNINDVIYKFTTDMPTRLPVVEKGEFRMDCAVISYDVTSGKAKDIKPFSVTTIV